MELSRRRNKKRIRKNEEEEDKKEVGGGVKKEVEKSKNKKIKIRKEEVGGVDNTKTVGSMRSKILQSCH